MPNPIINKITLKTVGIDDPESLVLTGKKKNIPAMRVYGLLRTATEKITDIGKSMTLTGDFEAVNLQTGEVFKSGKAYLPTIAEGPICEMLFQAQATDPKASVKFALDVTVSYFESKFPKGAKYTWGVTSLFDTPEDCDPLSEIRKMLPAPKATKEKK
jgi:hypothetical protein